MSLSFSKGVCLCVRLTIMEESLINLIIVKKINNGNFS